MIEGTDIEVANIQLLRTGKNSWQGRCTRGFQDTIYKKAAFVATAIPDCRQMMPGSVRDGGGTDNFKIIAIVIPQEEFCETTITLTP